MVLITPILLKLGLVGLFFGSLTSSLWFIPGYASLLLPVYLALKFNPYHILILMTLGAIIGEVINYYCGFMGAKLILKKDIKKGKKWLNKWGDLSLFIVNLIPLFPSDFISILVGFLKMDLKTFIISMGLGKFFQYALLIFGIELITRFIVYVPFIN